MRWHGIVSATPRPCQISNRHAANCAASVLALAVPSHPCSGTATCRSAAFTSRRAASTLLRATHELGQTATSLRLQDSYAGKVWCRCRSVTLAVTPTCGRRSSGVLGHPPSATSATRNTQTSSISILSHGQKVSNEIEPWLRKRRGNGHLLGVLTGLAREETRLLT
jgi:hypothetical protein